MNNYCTLKNGVGESFVAVVLKTETDFCRFFIPFSNMYIHTYNT